MDQEIPVNQFPLSPSELQQIHQQFQSDSSPIGRQGLRVCEALNWAYGKLNSEYVTTHGTGTGGRKG